MEYDLLYMHTVRHLLLAHRMRQENPPPPSWQQIYTGKRIKDSRKSRAIIHWSAAIPAYQLPSMINCPQILEEEMKILAVIALLLSISACHQEATDKAGYVPTTSSAPNPYGLKGDEK